MASKEVKYVDMTDKELEKMLNKAQNKPLTKAEIDKLRNMGETLKFILGELDKKRVSVKRLQKLIFGEQSEKLSKLDIEKEIKDYQLAETEEDLEEDSKIDKVNKVPSDKSDRKKAKGHGRLKADDYNGAEQIYVKHPDLKHKQKCPKCNKGKIYQQKQPQVFIRFTGSAPVDAKVWRLEQFRCGSCGATFVAPLPKAAGPPEKHDASVTSTIALMRYGFGMPFNRLATLQKNVGIPLPATTQWDLVNRAADEIESVFVALMREASCGDVVYNDDTTSTVLERIKELNQNKTSGKKNERVGTYTTGILSTTDKIKVALYLTGSNHAGENLQKVLSYCEIKDRSIIQMCDGSANNTPHELPDGLKLIESNCMSHARRKYVEIADSFPEKCLHVLRELGKIYKNDKTTRKEKMTSQERLAYHQKYSKSVIDDLKNWLQQQLDEKEVEPNSSFGKAIAYMLKRWDKLTKFLTVASVPLDNNICERALKRAIRHRKNSMFYKTLHGAYVGDMFMSLIHTCELNKVNPFDYLTKLIAAGDKVKENPELWFPWLFCENKNR